MLQGPNDFNNSQQYQQFPSFQNDPNINFNQESKENIRFIDESKGNFKFNQIKTEKVVHQCHLCSESFSRKREFEKHLRKSHSPTCDVCGRTFPNESILETHKTKNIICRTQEFSSPQTPDRQICQRYQSGIGNKNAGTHPCVYCPEILDSANQLSQHKQVVHIPKCHICGKVLAKYSSLNRHLLIHQKPSQRKTGQTFNHNLSQTHLSPNQTNMNNLSRVNLSNQNLKINNPNETTLNTSGQRNLNNSNHDYINTFSKCDDPHIESQIKEDDSMQTKSDFLDRSNLDRTVLKNSSIPNNNGMTVAYNLIPENNRSINSPNYLKKDFQERSQNEFCSEIVDNKEEVKNQTSSFHKPTESDVVPTMTQHKKENSIAIDETRCEILKGLTKETFYCTTCNLSLETRKIFREHVKQMKAIWKNFNLTLSNPGNRMEQTLSPTKTRTEPPNPIKTDQTLNPTKTGTELPLNPTKNETDQTLNPTKTKTERTLNLTKNETDETLNAIKTGTVHLLSQTKTGTDETLNLTKNETGQNTCDKMKQDKYETDQTLFNISNLGIRTNQTIRLPKNKRDEILSNKASLEVSNMGKGSAQNSAADDDETTQTKFSKKPKKCVVDMDSKQSLLTCPKCSKVFCSKKQKIEHMQKLVCSRVDPQKRIENSCHHCPRSFTCKTNLIAHIANEHLKKRDLKCDRCPKCFATQQRLRHHIRSVHDDVKQDCQVCFKTFKGKYSLKTHMDSKHFVKKEMMNDD